MIVAVQGTNTFHDYQVFLRSMAVAMSNLPDTDREFYIYSAGPGKVNDMVSEFVNLSERGMKARKRKIKFFKVAPSWIEENIDQVDYCVFLSSGSEPAPKLLTTAKLKNIESDLFSY